MTSRMRRKTKRNFWKSDLLRNPSYSLIKHAGDRPPKVGAFKQLPRACRTINGLSWFFEGANISCHNALDYALNS